MERRDFVKTSAGALLAGSLGNGTRVSARSANDTVRVAVIGFRGQGGTHIRNYLRMQNVEVAALCDVDPTVLAKGVADVEKASGKKPATFSDVRKLLEDKSIDAVSIATPNHWHSLMAIWACQAGKDVYVEKPCSHTYWEGKKLVEAARKYNRIVQHGTLTELRHLTRTTVVAETRLHADRLDSVPGVAHVDRLDGRVSFDVDTDHLDEAMSYLATLEIRSLVSHPPTLEELFLRQYGEQVPA